MTQIFFNLEQIQTLLKAIEILLVLIESRPEYKNIEATEEFTRSNDFNLLDVINSLNEVQEAIENFKSARIEGNGA